MASIPDHSATIFLVKKKALVDRILYFGAE